MKFFFSVLLAIIYPVIFVALMAQARKVHQEAKLYRMGGHPRQRQLQRRWGHV